ncbi:MAG TPA: cytochrome P450, partial [Dongiaceae bacterium]|nr:cytochrome P450 [Dongiaceae bacterium]
VLRLHPPLIVLMRQVSEPLVYKNFRINVGDMVWAAPPVTHRMSHLFANPEVFDPDRYADGRAEDKNLMAYQPFGGGKHKCSGNAFAMFQIKAIFSVLLRKYDFELVDPPETYVDNYGEMIVQPKSPCRIRFRRRPETSFKSRYGSAGAPTQAASGCPVHQAAPEVKKVPSFTISIDRQLCQGHSMCMGEAPDLFRVDSSGFSHILQASPDMALLEKARSAAQYCPNQAISIKVDE